MNINRIDHLVLTVKDIDETVRFYTSVMGMEKIEFVEARIHLAFGQQKINLHQLGNEFEPKALQVVAGSADLCFIIDTPIQQAIDDLAAKGIQILEGPVYRTGALGKIISAYFRDPDGNLIEVSNYVNNSKDD
ncbi:VOC family protein [Photobacterium leiognathi]|uniref:VOC family protein n=1 Tax=Photobacterium leiognathi TaxID=553611 RepID=UPI002738C0D1|nr:VOC family protein [Photobacterium leiognathi]